MTRSLLAAGVFLGESFVEPQSYNPKGLFEDKVTNQLDETLLNRIERRWNSLLLPDSVDPEVAATYQKDLKENVFRRFEGIPLWGLKDPRISRLWPYWLPVFVEMRVEPVFILANRHPYSVANSLFKRNQMPEAQSLALWAVHQLDALEALLQHGGLVVDYDLMMDRPRQELQRIASFLGVEAQLDPDEVAKFECDFLADELRHSRYSGETTAMAASQLQALCLAIYDELLGLAQLPCGLTPDAVEHAQTLFVAYRSELERSREWMLAIDAIQMSLEISTSPSGDAESIECESRLYLSEILDGVPQSYTESRGTASLYSISMQRQIVRLPLPTDLKTLARIRLDPSNRPVAVILHHLVTLQADGTETWRWGGGVQFIRNAQGLAIRETADGVLLVCWNDDPQFDLALPLEVLAGLQGGACLLVELTPYPILEACADVLRQDDRLIADLRVAAAENSTFGAEDAKVAKVEAGTRVPGLSVDLENVAVLLKTRLARNDQTIAERSMQLRAMRDELLRAEAQLDFLKDIMLGGREEDRL